MATLFLLNIAMSQFSPLFFEKLAIFQPFLHKKVMLRTSVFVRFEGTVADFIDEMGQTITLIQQAERDNQSDYLEIHTQKLITQFDALQHAVAKMSTAPKAQYQSSYRFPRHVHQLPVRKRLQEYHKALRALNEKILWLSEQSYLCPISEREAYLTQIQETEYRKSKCQLAIDELELQLKT
ncbi:hypothetical protein A4G19_11765 [Pasteurellaceae bacterium Macca]|nr:hypothetical protein [Pasteurellaceae bacterium Macca]